MTHSLAYPPELEALEAAAIARRRAIVTGPADPRGLVIDDRNEEPPPATAAPPAAGESTRLPADAVGVALSGGGIRSATFCLGVMQAMAARRLLRRIDVLSTVSGGGYCGAFLGRFYDRLRPSPPLAADVVETTLTDASSGPIRWLRAHGRYIAPAGRTDLAVDFAIFLRNFLTVQAVLGALAFAAYGAANAVRYALAEPVASVLPFVGIVGWSDMPVGHFVTALSGRVLWSPWFIPAELVLLLLAAPQALGYWLASQDRTERFSPPALTTAFLVLLVLLGLAVTDGLNVPAVFGAAAVLLAFPAVEHAWYRVRRDNAAVGTGGPHVEQLRARTHLSRDLGLSLSLAGMVAYFAAVDTAGRTAYEAFGRQSTHPVTNLARIGAGLLALLPLFRGGAKLLASVRTGRPASAAGGVGGLYPLLNTPAVAFALAAVLAAPPLLVVSYLAHAAYDGGAAVGPGLAATAVALVVSFVLGLPWAIALVNRSSLQATYAARIARAYLGATNPQRDGTTDDDVRPGDDVDTLPAYRPHEAGGPLHLINLCVNQTVDPSSLRTAGDRLGTVMACSPLAVTVAQSYHAQWNTSSAAGTATLDPLGHPPGRPHPLLGADDAPAAAVEALPLRDWTAISGAAFGPGMGSMTNPAAAVLLLLANLRVGYWWDSGLTAGDRGTRPRVSFVRRLLWLLPDLFQTQGKLAQEAMAQFRGPWDRFWYLSDGGHFENLGGYELVRRRLPVMILIDAGADPTYAAADFANFQRRVRIDFGAEVEPFGTKAWDAVTAAATAAHPADADHWRALTNAVAVARGEGGPLDAIACPSAAPAGDGCPLLGRHAALFRVRYVDAPDEWSVLLYVKASLTGDEPSDLLTYRADHPTFPHQSTAEQFFDEPQWESYRRLGEHVAAAVLGGETASTTADGLFWPAYLRMAADGGGVRNAAAPAAV